MGLASRGVGVAGAASVEALLRRRSSTIVAIGALRSGKTHTLYGPAEQLCNPSDASWKAWGLLPRAAHHLSARLQSDAAKDRLQ